MTDVYFAPDEAWKADAVCPETDPASFFPEKGQSTAPAKAICKDCPVKTACLDWAITHGIRFGIWGGLSEKERRALKHKQQDAA